MAKLVWKNRKLAHLKGYTFYPEDGMLKVKINGVHVATVSRINDTVTFVDGYPFEVQELTSLILALGEYFTDD